MTITWGKCGHPLRDRFADGYLECNVCHLLALSTVKAREYGNGTFEGKEHRRDTAICTFVERMKAAKEYAAREDEANACPGHLLSDDVCASVERGTRLNHVSAPMPWRIENVSNVGHTGDHVPCSALRYDVATGKPLWPFMKPDPAFDDDLPDWARGPQGTDEEWSDYWDMTLGR